MTVAIKNVEVKKSDYLLQQQSTVRVEMEQPVQGYSALVIRYVPTYLNYHVQGIVAATAKVFRIGEKSKAELVDILNSLEIEPCPELVQWLDSK